MSNTAHYTQITEPELLDVVDDAWLQDKLPDDSECCARPGGGVLGGGLAGDRAQGCAPRTFRHADLSPTHPCPPAACL